MSKRKLWKRKVKSSTEEQPYTIADFVTEEVDKFGAQIEKVLAEAKEGGKHGVMIVANDDVYICDLVPYGRVWRAGSQEAVDNLRAAQEK